MKTPDLQVNFRMPVELKARLEAASKESRRSLTAELVARLEESFAGKPEPQAITQHEAAIHTLAMLYQETLERIADIKKPGRLSKLSKAEEIELLHEEATAKYLRHAIARAAQPHRGKSPRRPTGVDQDVHTAVLEAESSKSNKT